MLHVSLCGIKFALTLQSVSTQKTTAVYGYLEQHLGKKYFNKKFFTEGRQMKINFISALCAASLVWIGTANADLITNGGFETGDLTGWTTNRLGDVVIKHTNDGPPGYTTDEGVESYYAALGFSSEAGTNALWQNFDVSGFNSIRVSFDWVFDFIDQDVLQQDVFVSILRDSDKDPKFTINKVVTGKKKTDTNLLYGTFSEIFDVTDFDGSNARLQFSLKESNGTIYSRAGIDNVSVQPVPEPASMLLVGTGLVGLVALGRRKAKKRENPAQ